MKIERLHTFTTQDWTQISKQFEGLYAATFNFVTENKGSVAEAKSVYVEAFLYYTQMIELHGMNMLEQGSDIVYSFARCIWIKKLRKRNVDVNFVKHRREFFEMEDAFHEIDSITERSSRTGDKLASIGEPARTLVLEYIGKGQNLNDVAQRLGYADSSRANDQVGKSLQKLIKDVEGKDLNISPEAFIQTLNVVLESSEKSDSNQIDKVNLAMVSRMVAMIKNYVNRNKRLELFKDMEVHFEAKVIPIVDEKPVASNSKKMKPVAMIAATILVAIVVSALTAFGLAEIRDNEKQISHVAMIPTQVLEEEPVVEVEEEITVNYTAFAINRDGYLLTTAEAVNGKTAVRLQGNGANRNMHGEVVAKDETLNIALIKCQFEKGTRIEHRFSPDNPELGQSLFSLGFPENNLYYHKMELNAASGTQTGKTRLDQYAPGSPIISEKGQIVGLVTGIDDQDGMAQLAYVEAVREFLSAQEMPEGQQLNIPTRNGLYYKDRVAQIDALTPFLWKIQ